MTKAPTGDPLRKVLSAAASREGELPVPSPFLSGRVRAAVRLAGPGSHPIGLLAWRLLPALTLAGLLLSGVSAVSTREAARARREAVAKLSPGDLLLAASARGGGGR